MILLLSAAAFCQMVWLPGTLLRRALRLRAASRLQGMAWTFALSLLANYLLVYLLTAAGLFRRPVVFATLAAELALLARLWLTAGQGRLRLDGREWLDRLRVRAAGRPAAQNLSLLLALWLFGLLLGELLAQAGMVFTFVDAAVGWNRFALDWTANRLPVSTWLYPQLLASNWSLVYQIVGGVDMQAVARGVMALFPLLSVLLFVDLGLRERRSGFFLAACGYVLALRHLYAPQLIGEGVMDIAVSFFALLAFHALRTPAGGAGPTPRARALAAVGFAAAAAVTKQSGFAVLLLVLLWNGWQLRRSHAAAPRKAWREVAAWLLVVALVVFSWFGPRLVLVQRGHERAGVREVVRDAHEGRTWTERLQHGWRQLQAGRGAPLPPAAAVGVALLLLAGLRRRMPRRVLLVVALPYTLLWASLYSYDTRNIAPALPFLALAAGEGAAWLGGGARRLLARLPVVTVPKLPLLAATALLLLAAGLSVLPDQKLLEGQRRQLRRLGNERLNEKLYGHFRRHGFCGKVFSAYPYFRLLPELREYWAPHRETPGVVYHLETVNRRNQALLAEITERIRSGAYRVVLATGQWRLLQVRACPPPGALAEKP